MHDMRTILRAIVNLESNPNWKIILEQMNARKAGYEKAIMRTKDEIEMRWHQGRLMELNDQLEGILNARSFLERDKKGEAFAKVVSGLNLPGT
jgi:hypothetical protein